MRLRRRDVRWYVQQLSTESIIVLKDQGATRRCGFTLAAPQSGTVCVSLHEYVRIACLCERVSKRAGEQVSERKKMTTYFNGDKEEVGDFLTLMLLILCSFFFFKINIQSSVELAAKQDSDIENEPCH